MNCRDRVKKTTILLLLLWKKHPNKIPNLLNYPHSVNLIPDNIPLEINFRTVYVVSFVKFL